MNTSSLRIVTPVACGLLALGLLGPTAAAAPPSDRPGQGSSNAPASPGGQGNGNSGNDNPGRPDDAGNASSGNSGAGNDASNPAANPNANASSRPATPGSGNQTANGSSQGQGGASNASGRPESTQGGPAQIPAAALRSPARSALERALDIDIDSLDETEQANELALLSCLSEAADETDRANARRKAQGKKEKASPSDWAPGKIKKLQEQCEEEVGDRGDYIVVFTPGAAASDRAKEVREQSSRRERNRLTVERTFDNVFSGALVNAGDKQIEALRKNPNVSFVEADGLAQAIEVQDPAPWGLDRSDQRELPLNGAFAYDSTGNGVDAYIVDTGIRADHVDFTGRVAGGFTAVEDGNGTSDCNGHGTHVAGTVAGASYGMAKASRLIPVRVLGCYGSGTWSGVISGLDYIAGQHASGTPAVANMSLGGGASSSIDLAVANLVRDGVTVVVAAGNSATDACSTSPAREPSAITVAASDSSDAQAYFSNYGSCVDIYAPGVGVNSAWYTGPTASASLSGTSMASPHVAGAAAQLLEGNPGASPDAIWSALRGAATTDVLTGLGGGSPNLLMFSGSATPPTDPEEPTDPQEPVATVPEAPTGVSAVAGARSATVSWTLPADGGSPITGQYVYVYDERNRLRGTIQVAGDVTTVEVDKLRPRKPYTFRVSAVNLVGQGDLSGASSPVSASNR